MKTKAYSYIRFSTHEQRKGHSVSRQDAGAIQYANANSLELDNILNMRDLGISAFRGKNINDGALGAFIKAVESGQVKEGSFLLIEDIDRLSRLPVMQALTVFQRIMSLGITIVTLKDGQKYSSERLQGDWTPLLPVLFSMARGHEESSRKSFLLSRAWKAKKDDARSGKPLGNTAPQWIRYSKESGYEIIPERQGIVKRIFKLSIDGYGLTAIAKILNSENISTFKKGVKWGDSSLNKVLMNRSTIGEYQPREGSGAIRTPVGSPIEDYFPAVIDRETFFLAQKASAGRKIARATRQSGNFNCWQGIAKCALCESALHIIPKGLPPKGHVYLRCYNAKKGACLAGYLRLDESEEMLKQILLRINSISLVQESSAETARQLAIVDQQIVEQEKSLTSLSDSLQSSGYSQTLDKEIRRIETELEKLKSQREKLSAVQASESIASMDTFFGGDMNAEIELYGYEKAMNIYAREKNRFKDAGYFDKEAFFKKLDLISYEGRNRINAFLKELKIITKIATGKPATYYVLQDGSPLIDIRRQGASFYVYPHTEEQLRRLQQLGETGIPLDFYSGRREIKI